MGDPLGFSGPFRELVFGVGDPLGFSRTIPRVSFRRWLNRDRAGKPRLAYKFGWRQVIESRVRPALVVVPPPILYDRFGLFQRFKPMQVQALVAE